MNDQAPSAKTSGRQRKCPMCGKPAERAFTPFCSRRCADLDLGKWLDGSYRIPAVEPPDGAPGEEVEGEGGEPFAPPGQRPQ